MKMRLCWLPLALGLLAPVAGSIAVPQNAGGTAAVLAREQLEENLRAATAELEDLKRSLLLQERRIANAREPRTGPCVTRSGRWPARRCRPNRSSALANSSRRSTSAASRTTSGCSRNFRRSPGKSARRPPPCRRRPSGRRDRSTGGPTPTWCPVHPPVAVPTPPPASAGTPVNPTPAARPQHQRPRHHRARL